MSGQAVLVTLLLDFTPFVLDGMEDAHLRCAAIKMSCDSVLPIQTKISKKCFQHIAESA